VASFVPIIPGPITGWFGLFVISQVEGFSTSSTLLTITFLVAIIIFIVDYFVPIIGSKYFGGSKYGVIGTTVGLLVGLLSPIPFGIIIGAFVGALIGEYIGGKNINEGIKPAIGSLIGIITSSIIKFITGFAFLIIYIRIISTNWALLF
jgi:uncharacterized protein YqgC (DUF456 family)